MKLRSRLRRLLGSSSPDKPSCPGCGRPMAANNDVCANCRSRPTDNYGG